jgi:predicted DNA-binding transcriptional regulator YafY
LAEHFGVYHSGLFTVTLDTLSLAGIPIYTEKGKGGGISLLPEFVLNKSILSEEEQGEILAALQGLSVVKTADTKEVLDKLGVFFNRNTTKWIEVNFSDWSYQNGENFSKLKTAILERRITEFDYWGASGEQSHRRIEPIQLWFKSKSWYLKSFCLTKTISVHLS